MQAVKLQNSQHDGRVPIFTREDIVTDCVSMLQKIGIWNLVFSSERRVLWDYGNDVLLDVLGDHDSCFLVQTLPML